MVSKLNAKLNRRRKKRRVKGYVKKNKRFGAFDYPSAKLYMDRI